MEGILFIVLWFGAALLHTWYDLKGKSIVESRLKANINS